MAFPASRNSVCFYSDFGTSGTTTSPCSPRTTCQASCSFSLPLRISPLNGAWTRTEDEGWKMEDGRNADFVPHSSLLIPRSSPQVSPCQCRLHDIGSVHAPLGPARTARQESLSVSTCTLLRDSQLSIVELVPKLVHGRNLPQSIVVTGRNERNGSWLTDVGHELLDKLCVPEIPKRSCPGQCEDV